MKTKTAKTREWVMQGVFTACACISILAVALICVFLFANGLPAMFEIGPLNFLLGTTWKPGNDIYGILPMILGSIYVTAGAIIVGVPIGLLTAIYMSKFALHRPAVNKVCCLRCSCWPVSRRWCTASSAWWSWCPPCRPWSRADFFKDVLGVKSGKGMSPVHRRLLLGIMILPTIITVSKASLDAVPRELLRGKPGPGRHP